jgi:hypothetical protein
MQMNEILIDERQKALIDRVSSRNIRIMKRCFMTGKQCIFSSQVAECASRELLRENFKTFVIMPFKPNLETFYLWSLKPFLTKDYGLLSDNVLRADEVRDIGYIVCEKICRKIQESDLVIADVSLKNANVFYEIGLSYGLERPIVLLQNQDSNEGVLKDKCFEQSLDLRKKPTEGKKHSVLEYPGIEKLNSDYDNHQIPKFVIDPPKRTKQISHLNIHYLRVDRNNGGLGHNQIMNHDITLNFNKVISAVVGVAMADILSDIKDKIKNDEFREPWENVVAGISEKDWSNFSSAKEIKVDGTRTFSEIANDIESSFCTIIDVTDNDPVACFWLGYGHARGLNVIPVYRLESGGERDHARDSITNESRLAFDIRALWYAEYESKRPYTFKTKIREILEHLLQRDLPDMQKRLFWNRFPPERKLKVFTGAIHNPFLNREMVGDWDVRTVSELFSYLPSVREASSIELVTPLYSPEEAYRRRQASEQIDRQTFIKEYNQSIKEQLRDT